MIYVAHIGTVSVATRCSLIGYEYQEVYVGSRAVDYGAFFAARWRERQTFVNVEHDVVPWPGAIESLLDCPERWCAFNYHLPCHRTGGIGTAGPLGCVKLSAEFIAATPTMWDEPCDWRVCDVRVRDVANPAGLTVHEHTPGVVHANPALLR